MDSRKYQLLLKLFDLVETVVLKTPDHVGEGEVGGSLPEKPKGGESLAEGPYVPEDLELSIARAMSEALEDRPGPLVRPVFDGGEG